MILMILLIFMILLILMILLIFMILLLLMMLLYENICENFDIGKCMEIASKGDVSIFNEIKKKQRG